MPQWLNHKLFLALSYHTKENTSMNVMIDNSTVTLISKQKWGTKYSSCTINDKIYISSSLGSSLIICSDILDFALKHITQLCTISLQIALQFREQNSFQIQ